MIYAAPLARCNSRSWLSTRRSRSTSKCSRIKPTHHAIPIIQKYDFTQQANRIIQCYLSDTFTIDQSTFWLRRYEISNLLQIIDSDKANHFLKDVSRSRHFLSHPRNRMHENTCGSRKKCELWAFRKLNRSCGDTYATCTFRLSQLSDNDWKQFTG